MEYSCSNDVIFTSPEGAASKLSTLVDLEAKSSDTTPPAEKPKCAPQPPPSPPVPETPNESDDTVYTPTQTGSENNLYGADVNEEDDEEDPTNGEEGEHAEGKTQVDADHESLTYSDNSEASII